MKVLSIGNSFSQDAHKWLKELADINDFEIELANLYIGGANLETHWTNIIEDNEDYDYEINGGEAERKIGIKEALSLEKWDIVTLQQCSSYSGMPETFKPYLDNLIAYVKENCPSAKIVFHETWAYEIDSDHCDFIFYENNQKKMADAIVSANEKIHNENGLDIIRAGEAVQYVRENISEFDYKNGGLSLNRDGYHLTFDYGRFTAAVTWLKALSGKNVRECKFRDFDVEKTNKIILSINKNEDIFF